MNDRDDPIIDACLNEILGGSTPPDLTARILQTLQQRQAGQPIPPPVLADVVSQMAEPVPPPVANSQFATPVINRSASPAMRRNSHRSRRVSLNWILSAAMLAIVMVSVGFWLVTSSEKQKNKTPNQVAQQPRDTKTLVPKSEHTPPTKSTNIATPGNLNHKSPTSPSSPLNSNSPKTEVASPIGVAQNTPKPDTLPPSFKSKQPTSTDAEMVAYINSSLKENWEANGVAPSPAATDSEWCRRTFLRLIGRIPTVEEVNAFVENKQPTKRQLLVDQLVNGDAYAEEYAANWASIWSGTLIGRSTNGEDGARIREGLQQFLRQAFHQNRPYNELVFDLISATGSNNPSDADYNGAVNFLIANANDKYTLATTKVSRVFLGSQLHCAQCHSHPANDWSQDQFWQLNAFFRQLHIERDRKTGIARVMNRDFDGEGTGTKDGEIYFEQRDGKMKVAYPIFIDGTSLPHQGQVTQIDRRKELAKLVSQSEQLSRAAVNRLWAHFLGFGFTKPVDDIGPHNSPSHPQLLARLSEEFAAQNYDIKKLMRWITLSEPFGLSSKISTKSLADMPDAGTPPLFSRYYTRQMQVEELFQSLQLLANARKTGGSASDREKAKQAFLGQVTKNMGNDEGGEEHLFAGIPQSLMMMNGELTRRALSPNDESMLGRVAESSLSVDEKIEHLFLAALSRKPTKRELSAANAVVAASGQMSVAGFQDLWWALLNSNEFILDH